MLDVITFGSATLDIFVKTPYFPISFQNKKRGIFVPLGEKIEGMETKSNFGGCGLNTAVSFAKQGLKVGFVGTVGNDIVGKMILDRVKELGLDSEFLFKTRRSSNISVILSKGVRDRTILIYRGASEVFDFNKFKSGNFKGIKYFYFSSPTGQVLGHLRELIDIAHKYKIKVVLNPSKVQLKSGTDKLRNILSEVDILILNQSEASILTHNSFDKPDLIFRHLLKLTPGIVIMTRGAKGSYTSDRKFIYKAGVVKTKVVDVTGAGDSFGSGFVFGLTKTNDVSLAIKFAMINSANCLKKWGAQEGFVKIKKPYPKIKISKEIISYN